MIILPDIKSAIIFFKKCVFSSSWVYLSGIFAEYSLLTNTGGCAFMERMNYRQRRKYKKYRSRLWTAIRQESLKRVRKMLRFVKADDDMIHSAISIGVCPEMVELLQQSAGMPEEEVVKCRLSQALEADDTESMQQFLNAGICPDIALDSYENRPLHRARSARMARLLLEAGAHVNAEDERSRTPLDWALAHPYQHRIQKQHIATLMRAGGKKGRGQRDNA